ncbi:MAG TPA: PAS domain-containing protein [Casimicrobiaceae bacterium]|nr:PAS domain-containing protein [Casimicrobiaceae bacterium]
MNEPALRLEDLLERLPVGVWIADGSCNKLYGNLTAFELLGLSTSADSRASASTLPAIPRAIGDNPSCAPASLEALWRCADSGTATMHCVHHVKTSTGQTRVLDVNIAPLIDAQGATLGAIGVYCDVTRRTSPNAARIESASEQLRKVTRATSALVSHCGADLRYRWASPRYAAWLGATPAKLIGADIEQVLGRATFARLLPFCRRALAGERVEFESEIEFAAAGRKPVHATYVPTRDGDGAVDGWVDTIEDMTRQMNALRRHERESEELLGTILHGLRGPLAPLQNGLNLLRHLVGKDERSHTTLDMMYRQIQRLVAATSISHERAHAVARDGALGSRYAKRSIASPAEPTRIVVADHESGAMSLATTLRAQGHYVVTANSAAEAVSKSERFHPHLIVLSLDLPQMGAAVSEIRALPCGAGAKLVAMITDGTAGDSPQASATGLDFHLAKPLGEADLDAILQSVPPQADTATDSS